MEITRKPCEERGAETRPTGPMGSKPPPGALPTAAPTAVFPPPTAPTHCFPLLHVHCPNPSPCFHSPIPLMCLSTALPQCSHRSVATHRQVPAPTTRCSAHCLTSTAQSHALLRNYWPSFLQLNCPHRPNPTDPTAPPTLPSPTPQHPRPQPLFPPLDCLKYYCSDPTSPPHSLVLNRANSGELCLLRQSFLLW